MAYRCREFNGVDNHLNNYGVPGPQIPDLIGIRKPSNQTPDNWINTGAFKAPASDFTIGNSALRLTQLRERAARNVDIAVSKTFGSEVLKAHIRGEFLNAFNYAQYNNVCLDLSGSNCVTGQAQGTENAPRTVQLSLKLTF